MNYQLVNVPAVLPEDSPYTSIHAASIRLPPHRLPPTTELLEAVDSRSVYIQEVAGDIDVEETVESHSRSRSRSGSSYRAISRSRHSWRRGLRSYFS
ncbi:unnamed protein product [Rhizophagus irregularis]|nr:unnamed protein product [Rhizophagus irregularis]